jgi:hypothetical protein
VLPACAVAGGLDRQVDFTANVRVLFDLFYPGVLPGTAVDVPGNADSPVRSSDRNQLRRWPMTWIVPSASPCQRRALSWAVRMGGEQIHFAPSGRRKWSSVKNK